MAAFSSLVEFSSFSEGFSRKMILLVEASNDLLVSFGEGVRCLKVIFVLVVVDLVDLVDVIDLELTVLGDLILGRKVKARFTIALLLKGFSKSLISLTLRL